MTQETVHIQIDKTLTAQELELLIHELAKKRSTMAPAVPNTKEEAIATPGTPALFEDKPSCIAVRLKNGCIRLWMRNRGIGWQAFNMELQNAAALRDWLNINVDGPADLFEDEFTHQTPH